MRTVFRFGLKDTWKRFQDDQSGIALIYVTVALPVLVGFSLLAIDVGRLSSLQSSLQHGADALALAGAGELDRRPDAIVRANRAVANLVTTNTSLFGTSVVTIDESQVSVRYLATIPGHGEGGTDADPITAAALNVNVASDNQLARFVEVTVTPQNFNTVFPVTFLGGASNTAQSSASAVAGFDAAVCDFTPMFMCNPYEPDGNTDTMRTTEIFAAVATMAERRKLIAFKRHDDGQWTNGNYGWLDSPLGNGANALRDAVAAVKPQACFIQNSLNSKPGNVASVAHAFNVRFDMYHGSLKKNEYPPAVNVRRGYVTDKTNGTGNWCNAAPTTAIPANAMGFPRDSCFAPQTCAFNNRIGNGIWDFDLYWSTNYPTFPQYKPAGYSNSNRPSRYFVYRYEIEHPNNLLDKLSPGGERGAPQCSTLTASDNPDRRIVYGAIVNCKAEEAAGNLGSGRTGPFTAAAFGSFFMAEPMDKDDVKDTLFTELVDVVEPGEANSVARDIVQLYR